MELVKNYIGSITKQGWIGIALALGFIIVIVISKKKYADTVEKAIRLSEQSFNSGEGQKKLVAAIAYIQNAITLMPWYVRLVIVPVISKKSIIDAIERTLQRISNTFGKGSKVDIKGNEEDGEK
ncbi:hypothetical protein [Fusobacterium nucleatum]|uniref:hypothetical protein n=1 Tax=Fusobacterium nucleatum TaxID=851 RepID=UPI000405BA48|nr:hypothetical protein [Fusobacterium nucleatum]ALF24714.1 hypothetical protein RO05_10165 [Fusobacterium nucleatum subsp. nucleatum ChDC F316]ASG26050.1 hypothetical protein RN84_03710 [Fusobacterium nucleatum subsp. nucleatum]